jgi:dihydroxyacetone kinase-like predicted kinase
MAELTQFEAKAYKRLYELYKGTLLTIINKAKNSAEYLADKPEEMKKAMEYIADEKQWDYCGIEDKTTSKIIDELEKCLE